MSKLTESFSVKHDYCNEQNNYGHNFLDDQALLSHTNTSEKELTYTVTWLCLEMGRSNKITQKPSSRKSQLFLQFKSFSKSRPRKNEKSDCSLSAMQKSVNTIRELEKWKC